MRKKLAAALILLFACAAAFAQGNSEAPADKPAEIAVVLKTLNSDYWRYVKDGCERAAKELGIKVTVAGPDSESDIDGQIAMIGQQLKAGCDAIIVAPNNSNAAIIALEKAVDDGIPVLAVDTEIGIRGETCFIGTSHTDSAMQAAEWAAKLIPRGAKAVIIYGQEDDPESNMRMEGYDFACNAAGVKVIARVSGQNATDGAAKAMEKLLKTYPGQIDLVFCNNDDTAIGASDACKSAGADDVIIVGFDGTASAINRIKAGDLIKVTVAQQPEQMGYHAVKNAYNALKGEKVNRVIYAPAIVITPENVNNY